MSVHDRDKGCPKPSNDPTMFEVFCSYDFPNLD